MPFPFVLVVTDGKIMRTLHRPAFAPGDLAALDAIIDKMVTEPIAQPVIPTIKEISPEKAATLTQSEIAREQGFTGDPCTNCGAFKLIRTGTCTTCTQCGANSGCS